MHATSMLIKILKRKKQINMKNKLLILFLIVSSCLISTKQIKSQSVIRGEIKDIDGVPLQSANVLLLKSTDSSLVTGMMSDTFGNYSFEKIKNGQYPQLAELYRAHD